MNRLLNFQVRGVLPFPSLPVSFLHQLYRAVMLEKVRGAFQAVGHAIGNVVTASAGEQPEPAGPSSDLPTYQETIREQEAAGNDEVRMQRPRTVLSCSLTRHTSAADENPERQWQHKQRQRRHHRRQLQRQRNRRARPHSQPEREQQYLTRTRTHREQERQQESQPWRREHCEQKRQRL